MELSFILTQGPQSFRNSGKFCILCELHLANSLAFFPGPSIVTAASQEHGDDLEIQGFGAFS